MKTNETESITLSFSGQVTIPLAELRHKVQEILLPSSSPTDSVKIIGDATAPPRLAYTLRETAELRGVSYITAYRLVQRGLLKSGTVCAVCFGYRDLEPGVVGKPPTSPIRLESFPHIPQRKRSFFFRKTSKEIFGEGQRSARLNSDWSLILCGRGAHWRI